MQMTLRTRLIDILPALVVFALVACFATFMLVEFVAREPLVVPPPQVTPADELPRAPAHGRTR